MASEALIMDITRLTGGLARLTVSSAGRNEK